ncbi:hypothetical protein D0Z06_11880 [Geodermatophilus marinus]|nr:hypothetical protein D0Z06_11880 [Geodermatophilus sp. LHW52908]
MVPVTDCPQAVYTSARRTLEGPGFGVFAVSAGWPAALGRTRTALGGLVAGSPGGGEAFGVVHRDGGRLLTRTVAASADGFGREGNYLVHLLWDGAGRLGPRDLLAVRRAGLFLDALPADAAPTTDLPPLPVPEPERAAPVLSGEDVDALIPPLARLLAALAAGRGELTLPPVTPGGRDVAAVLFDVLPRTLAAPVSLSAGPVADRGDRAPVRVRLDAAPAAGRRPTAADTERARTLLEAAGKGDLAPDTLTDVRQLDVWLFADAWADADADALTPEQVGCVLDSVAAPRWLARGRNTAAALELADDPHVARPLAGAVARDAAAALRVREQVLAGLLDEVLDGAEGPGERAVELAALTQGDLCRALASAVTGGRRVARLGGEARLLVEQTLSLGVELPLLELTDDLWELAQLATRRRVVGDALVAQWPTAPADRQPALLGHLLVADAGWLSRLEPVLAPTGLPQVLRWAALRLDAPGVERLALTVATGGAAGRGWALREVLLGAELPADEAAAVLARNLTVLLADDGWPRDVAAALARGRAGGDDTGPRRRRGPRRPRP